jgi:hypothetical protein
MLNIQTVFRLNWLIALPSYEVKAAMERDKHLATIIKKEALSTIHDVTGRSFVR